MTYPAFSFWEDSFLCFPNVSQSVAEFRREQIGPFPLQMVGTSRQTEGCSLCREHRAPQSPARARGLSASGCLREFPAPCGGARESRAPFPRAGFQPEAGFGCGLLTGPSRFLRKRRLMAPLRSRPSSGPGHLVRHSRGPSRGPGSAQLRRGRAPEPRTRRWAAPGPRPGPRYPPSGRGFPRPARPGPCGVPGLETR